MTNPVFHASLLGFLAFTAMNKNAHLTGGLHSLIVCVCLAYGAKDWVLTFSAGYFTHELVFEYLTKRRSEWLLHGALCTLSYWMAFQYHVYPDIARTFLGLEYSTLYYHLWRLMPSPLTAILFGLMFLTVRIGWGLQYMYLEAIPFLMEDESFNVHVRMLCILLIMAASALNIYWAFQILKRGCQLQFAKKRGD